MHIYFFFFNSKLWHFLPFLPTFLFTFSVFLQFNPYRVRAVHLGTCIYGAVSVKLLGSLCWVSTSCSLSPSERSSCLRRCYWTEFQEFTLLYSGWILLLNIQIPESLETLAHRSDCASYERSAFADSLLHVSIFHCPHFSLFPSIHSVARATSRWQKSHINIYLFTV